jgi:hypothetical protein
VLNLVEIIENMKNSGSSVKRSNKMVRFVITYRKIEENIADGRIDNT